MEPKPIAPASLPVPASEVPVKPAKCELKLSGNLVTGERLVELFQQPRFDGCDTVTVEAANGSKHSYPRGLEVNGKNARNVIFFYGTPEQVQQEMQNFQNNLKIEDPKK